MHPSSARLSASLYILLRVKDAPLGNRGRGGRRAGAARRSQAGFLFSTPFSPLGRTQRGRRGGLQPKKEALSRPGNRGCPTPPVPARSHILRDRGGIVGIARRKTQMKYGNYSPLYDSSRNVKVWVHNTRDQSHIIQHDCWSKN